MTAQNPPSRPRRGPMAGAPRVGADERPDAATVRAQREDAARPYRTRGYDARTAEDVRS